MPPPACAMMRASVIQASRLCPERGTLRATLADRCQQTCTPPLGASRMTTRSSDRTALCACRCWHSMMLASRSHFSWSLSHHPSNMPTTAAMHTGMPCACLLGYQILLTWLHELGGVTNLKQNIMLPGTSRWARAAAGRAGKAQHLLGQQGQGTGLPGSCCGSTGRQQGQGHFCHLPLPRICHQVGAAAHQPAQLL